MIRSIHEILLGRRWKKYVRGRVRDDLYFCFVYELMLADSSDPIVAGERSPGVTIRGKLAVALD
jgi:hypothetical protein